jgi:hypothetical protein
MPHIATLCPHCNTRYQLQPEMIGKRMRCPNPLCREIFLVQEEAVAGQEAEKPATPEKSVVPASEARPITGTVGDMVPLLPAAPVEPLPQTEVPVSTGKGATQAPATETAAPGWIEPPPRRKPKIVPPAARTVKPDEAVAKTENDQRPVEIGETVPPSWQAPPPVRGTAAQAIQTEPVANGPGTPDRLSVQEEAWTDELAEADGYLLEEETTTVAPVAASSGQRRRNMLLVVGLLGILAAAGTLSYWLVQGRHGDNELQRATLAARAYQDGHFAEAAQLYHYLELDFPNSPQRPVYRFLGQFAELRDPIHSTQADPKEVVRALQALLTFVREEAGNPLLEEHRTEIGDTLFKAAEDLTSAAASRVKIDPNFAQELAGYAKGVLAETANYQPNDFSTQSRLEQAGTTVQAINAKLSAFRHRQELLDLLVQIGKHPVGNIVERSHALVQEYARTQSELAGDPEVREVLKKMPALHRAGIKYVARSLPAKNPLPGDAHIRLYFADVLQKGKTTVRPDQPAVLALAKGVLYAFDPVKGNMRWVMQVGLDNTTLPLWLPATPTAPERLLVLRADTRSLLAIESATGNILWQQELSGPCLGRPVLLDTRAFVAGPEGHVEEIDTTTGKLTGYYELGQPLTGWGARQPGTSLLFFPADEYCIYELDADQHRCTNVLYSKHRAQALRGPPIVTAGLLLLRQTDGPKKTKLRTFSLPLEEGGQNDLLPAKDLPGWCWFDPFLTPEQLALVTDEGWFGAFGLKQPYSHDAPLFTLFEKSLGSEPTALIPLRAQVVHVDGIKYWLMNDGKLLHLETALARETGPKLLSPWVAPLGPLGSPLHAGQARQTETGATALFTVTEVGTPPRCLLSAVETGDGVLRWQYQLGLPGGPVIVPIQEGAIALHGQGQGFVFDAKLAAVSKAGQWLDAGAFVAQQWTAPGPTLQLLARPESKTVFILTGGPDKVYLRQIPQDKKGTIKTWDLSLPSPLAGTAAMGTQAVVLPLANSNLLRFGYTGATKLSLLHWRAEHADVDAPGQVLWLGGDEYCLTDGSKGVRLIRWPEGQAEQLLDSLQLESRIARPITLLPGQAGKAPGMVIADAQHGLSLVHTNPLQLVRHWPGTSPITAGPFVRAGAIGCVIDKQQLLWFDPGQAKPIWTWTAAAAIVGEPQLVGKNLLVADLSGRLTLLDPATGSAVAGVALTGSAAPSAAPVPWTEGRVFAPLTDGTILLLAIK